MKVLFATNNEITKPLYQWLKQQAGEEVTLYSEKPTFTFVKELSPDIFVSYNYKYIISEEIITLMDGKIVNLHISFLPWNRGADPNLWSFLENTPNGVTIHLIDKDVDTGNILLQKRFELNERVETLESSYKKLHDEIQKLFIVNWTIIKNFQISPSLQLGQGSCHYKKDSVKIKDFFGDKLWFMPIYKLKQELKNTRLL